MTLGGAEPSDDVAVAEDPSDDIAVAEDPSDDVALPEDASEHVNSYCQVPFSASPGVGPKQRRSP
jgi:hypothetical protein